jgi:hypothetical protein
MSERDRKTDRENRGQPGRRSSGKQESGGPQDGKNQGIMRDGLGQEQPADKERAQRVHKTKEGQTRR